MKRIAFISDGHTGSTIPLAKQFIKLGFVVDFYILTGCKVTDVEGIKIKSFRTFYGLHKIDRIKANSLYNYFESEYFNFYSISSPRPFSRAPILRGILKFFRMYFFKSICQKLNLKDYYAINLIGRKDSEIFIWFHNYLNCNCILTSLHEVCDHNNQDYIKPSKLLNYLFTNKKEIVVHSLKTLEDILSFNSASKKHIHLIHYGLFESYLTINPLKMSILPKKYILFYGNIKPYKGLNVLYNAVFNNPKFFNEIKIVIAGNGYDPVMDRIISDNRFILINHFLSNEELVELIKKAYLIVCPYISVSQSGIPQTAFVFNKPVIASNIGSFQEIIKDNENGLLFKTEDANDLARVINMLIENNCLYNELITNIEQFERLNQDYCWRNISYKYEKIIRKINDKEE